MKVQLLIALFGLGACSRAATAPGAPSTGTADDAIVKSKNAPLRPLAAQASADAERQGETVVRVHYPFLGRTAALRGGQAPLSWDNHTPLEYIGDETYEFRTRDWQAGSVEVKPILVASNEWRWSTGSNFHVAAGTTTDLYPAFYDQRGRVVSLFEDFHSPRVQDRDVWAYLPPSYYENTLASYPVLYMHDGQNLFVDEDAFGGQSWEVSDSLDAAFLSGQVQEIIVIGVGNTSDRMTEYTPVEDLDYPGSGTGDNYLAFLIDELRPQVNAALRTRTDTLSTGLMGSSLGGLISAYAGIAHGQVFGLIGALSPSTWWDDTWIISAVQQSSASQRAGKVYVDSGNAGPSKDDVSNTAKLAQAYRSLGYQDDVSLKYLVQNRAQHSEYYWAQRFPGAAAFLFGAR